MPIAAIRRDVRREFKRHATATLAPSARAAQAATFNTTVGRFAKQAARLKPPVDVWQLPKFRSFILGQTKKIATEASKGAKGGVISSVVFTKAAVKVMRKTQKFCKLAIKKGKIQDLRAGHYSDYSPGDSNGEVCTDFLATKTY